MGCKYQDTRKLYELFKGFNRNIMGCKLESSILELAGRRFNRNIMGCKFCWIPKTAKHSYRFNRNIMGCKSHKLNHTLCAVLRFNRNIMGCK